MNADSDPLDWALRAAAPLGRLSLDVPEVHDAVAALLAQTRADHELELQDDAAVLELRPAGTGAGARKARRHRRGVRAVVATSVILAAGTGVAAAGGFLPLRTGVFGLPGMTENDTSEYLNADSPEVAPLMRSYLEEMPLAPGFSVDPLIERFQSSGHTIVQADGLRGQVLFWSTCSWELTWLDAQTSGDTAAQAEATAVLTEIPDWPIVPVIDGGGVAETLDELAAAAAAGDPGPLQRDTSANCDLDIAR